MYFYFYAFNTLLILIFLYRFLTFCFRLFRPIFFIRFCLIFYSFIYLSIFFFLVLLFIFYFIFHFLPFNFCTFSPFLFPVLISFCLLRMWELLPLTWRMTFLMIARRWYSWLLFHPTTKDLSFSVRQTTLQQKLVSSYRSAQLQSHFKPLRITERHFNETKIVSSNYKHIFMNTLFSGFVSSFLFVTHINKSFS